MGNNSSIEDLFNLKRCANKILFELNPSYLMFKHFNGYSHYTFIYFLLP